MDFREGDVVAGKYRVERVLGRGGMGMVVAARHVALGEPVAIKFLLPEMLENQEALGRFLQEARAAARIKNEHIARVTDVGELDGGAPYIVMEYLEGKDLGELLKARGPLPIEEAVDYVVQTCEAIASAHALGIIHRDLKPPNLMLITRSDRSAFIKVLDFGISKVTAVDASMVLTRTAAAMGSPLYMSPEQMTSARDVDGRADIWSLGTILYELLTGAPPFRASSLPGLAVLVATTPHRPMRDIRPEVPAELDVVVANCLAKQRDERFATVAELAAALSPFAPEHAAVSIRSSARILGSDPPKSVPASLRPSNPAPHSTAPVVRSRSDVRESKNAETLTKVRNGHPEKPRRSLLFVVGAGVILGIAVIGGVLALSERRRTEASVEASGITPHPAASPSTSTSPSALPEAPRQRPADIAVATRASATISTAAPALPPLTKPATPAKQRQTRPRTTTKPSGKEPESAYEHM